MPPCEIASGPDHRSPRRCDTLQQSVSRAAGRATNPAAESRGARPDSGHPSEMPVGGTIVFKHKLSAAPAELAPAFYSGRIGQASLLNAARRPATERRPRAEQRRQRRFVSLTLGRGQHYTGNHLSKRVSVPLPPPSRPRASIGHSDAGFEHNGRGLRSL